MADIRFNDNLAIGALHYCLSTSTDLTLKIFSGTLPGSWSAGMSSSSWTPSGGILLLKFVDSQISIDTATGEVTTTSSYAETGVNATATCFKLSGDTFGYMLGTVGTSGTDLLISNATINQSQGYRHTLSGLVLRLTQSTTVT